MTPDLATPIHLETLVDVLPACASVVSLVYRIVENNRDTYTSRCLRRMTCPLGAELGVAFVEAVSWIRGLTVDLMASKDLPQLSIPLRSCALGSQVLRRVARTDCRHGSVDSQRGTVAESASMVRC